jgi:hypothetical protein
MVVIEWIDRNVAQYLYTAWVEFLLWRWKRQHKRACAILAQEFNKAMEQKYKEEYLKLVNENKPIQRR